MIGALRDQFNNSYTEDKYHDLLRTLVIDQIYKPNFRIAETPIFLPEGLKEKLIDACNLLIDYIISDAFKVQSQSVLSRIGMDVPNETAKPEFIQMDFGISKDQFGELTPYLIEMQGFPSLYFFQKHLAQAYKNIYNLDGSLTNFFNGIEPASYVNKLKDLIIGDEDPKHTVLLEIEPEKQNTAYDFYASAAELGLKVLDLKDLHLAGNDCYYFDGEEKIAVSRIYNRVIFDELFNRKDLEYDFDFNKPITARWIGHPNWYFKISKYIMPFIKDNPYVPFTVFLDSLEEIPEDLENYVLKPLFSFSGTGVVYNVNQSDIDAVPDPENWVLQRKVVYSPVINSIKADEPVKCEIRMMLIWPDGSERPELVNNIVRLSKGDMIGVKYNKDKDWVGASCAFFQS